MTIVVETRKFQADGQGNESEVPVADWIDIGAFARPAEGRQYGETLYRERVHLSQRASTFTFTTSQLRKKRGSIPSSCSSIELLTTT